MADPPRSSVVLRSSELTAEIDAHGAQLSTLRDSTARDLLLADALFRDDVLIFDHLKSRSVIYGSAKGPRIRVSFPDAPYLGIWTKPGAHFICIEPWHGVTDRQGFSGDFREKEGVFVLSGGNTRETTMTITLLE